MSVSFRSLLCIPRTHLSFIAVIGRTTDLARQFLWNGPQSCLSLGITSGWVALQLNFSSGELGYNRSASRWINRVVSTRTPWGKR
jgi:hypothetical protein